MPRSRFTMSLRPGLLLLIGTGLLWGTIGICGRLIFDRTDLDAMEISWMRTLFAAPACFLVGYRMLGRGLFDVRRRDVFFVAALAIAIYGSQFLYLISVSELGVSVSTLLTLCAIPVLVALFSVVVQGEHLSRIVVIALLGAVAGTALLTLGEGGSAGDGAVALGVGTGLFSAALASVYTIGSRSFVQRYPPITALALGFPIALILFAPVMRGGHINTEIPISAWLLLIYMGIGTQGIAYLFYQWGLKTESATVASIVTLLEPVLAAVLAWIIFGERLGSLGFVGAGLLIVGLGLISFSPPPVSVREEAPVASL